jgi:prevent-host-death family protein
MSEGDSWKLQDAKARFSEVVRRARQGQPQQVTVHGKQAVVVVDPERFEVRPKRRHPRTLAGFIEASKKYRGAADGVVFERPTGMTFKSRPFTFDEDDEDDK